MKTFKWTVEFEVAECWVEDGFNLTDSRALSLLANDLRYANIGTELGAKVINAPPDEEIAKAQGYSTVEEMPTRARRDANARLSKETLLLDALVYVRAVLSQPAHEARDRTPEETAKAIRIRDADVALLLGRIGHVIERATTEAQS
jgi:hypothetical protein